jgi:hypothetical protein
LNPNLLFRKFNQKVYHKYINISSSTFKNAKSKFGGVFLIRGTYKINIDNCFFQNNRALLDSDGSGESGGVGFFECFSDPLECELIVESSIFLDNETDYYASNFFYDSKIQYYNPTFNTIIQHPSHREELKSFSYPLQIILMQNENKVDFFETKSGVAENLTIIVMGNFCSNLK